jgi:HEAT repeat protein
MTQISQHDEQQRVIAALRDPSGSVRLRSALRAGSTPTAAYIDPLIERCAVVRDMLTWALIQHDHEEVIERLLVELGSDVAQARAQALHTLSKIGDQSVWPAITSELLTDADDEVARTAWRTAANLVPAGSEQWLAETLSTQWARGDRDVRLSLSQAFIMLDAAATPLIERAAASDDEHVRLHALATQRLIDDPDLGFDGAVAEAKRVHTLRGAPTIEG